MSDAALLRRVRRALELDEDATELEVLGAIHVRDNALAVGYAAIRPRLEEGKQLLGEVHDELHFEWAFSEAVVNGRAGEDERMVWRRAWRENPDAALAGLRRSWEGGE